VVVFPFDTAGHQRFWLTRDYLPGFAHLAAPGPSLAERRAVRDLRADIDSGFWLLRNSDLVGRDAADLGARLLVA
jgi:hypothetical protein